MYLGKRRRRTIVLRACPGIECRRRRRRAARRQRWSRSRRRPPPHMRPHMCPHMCRYVLRSSTMHSCRACHNLRHRLLLCPRPRLRPTLTSLATRFPRTSTRSRKSARRCGATCCYVLNVQWCTSRSLRASGRPTATRRATCCPRPCRAARGGQPPLKSLLLGLSRFAGRAHSHPRSRSSGGRARSMSPLRRAISRWSP